jgi:Uma2 family endonuclease
MTTTLPGPATIAALPSVATAATVAELLERLGNIPPDRVLLQPALGTATEQDVLRLAEHEDRLCELVDGVLVEKPMGTPEAVVAMAVSRALDVFVDDADLGIVLPPDGMLRLSPGLVRIPDVSFISRARLAGRRIADHRLLPLAPNLAIEVLSHSNTDAEMRRKIGEYFGYGAELVWLIDPARGRRTVAVYTSPDDVNMLGEEDHVDGGRVLPGFTMSVRMMFAKLDREWTA